MKGGERFRADVVLDAFRIRLGDVVWHTKRAKEFQDQLVALTGFFSQLGAFLGKKNGAVRPAGNPAIALQTGDRADHGDMGDPQTPREVDGASLTGRGHEFGDSFDIVLGGFNGMLAAGLAQGGGLRFRGADARRRFFARTGWRTAVIHGGEQILQGGLTVESGRCSIGYMLQWNLHLAVGSRRIGI